MCKTIDKDTYCKFKKSFTQLVHDMVMDSEPDDGYFSKPDDKEIEDLLDILDLKRESPFSEISPTPWGVDRECARLIVDARLQPVTRVALRDSQEADKELILAAPDLREQLYAAYTDSTDKTAMGTALRKAGVKI